MFDAKTASILRSAPEVPGLDPIDLPALLTYHYANLASVRLGGLDSNPDESSDAWSLERIADTYELMALLQSNSQTAQAAAFVAGTAQQILARRAGSSIDDQVFANVDRDRLDPTLAAPLLFLIADQYADANEAASLVNAGKESQTYEAMIVSEHIVDLSKGRLLKILERSTRWRVRKEYSDLDEEVLASLLETIATGIEMYAAEFLNVDFTAPVVGRFEQASDAFKRVLRLTASTQESTILGCPLIVVHAGPNHLASLLLSATDGMRENSLVAIPPPAGASDSKWRDWLQFRAEQFPFVWPNHREAIAQGFHQTGTSSVVVLPTGAGKTTVSSLKIAGALARRKKVVFLAPTHALVEQLIDDLQEMFPSDLMGTVASGDFDMLFLEDAIFQDIEVMTPERCLAMLSFAPDAFTDVGLLVFDECHLLSPESGKIRRAMDGMLCVLAFNHVVPDADLLFLSAMVKNGNEIAEWLSDLTGRPAVAVDLLWKPSRQARGVIIYDNSDLGADKTRAIETQNSINAQKGKIAKGLRKAADEELGVKPYAIWGLQHNWHSEESLFCLTTPLLSDEVMLAGKLQNGRSIRLTPNANSVASKIASVGASQGLKTIVFVNTKKDAIKVAKDISELIGEKVEPTEDEEKRWKILEQELGGLQHSVLSGSTVAVPHNSSMLRLERELAERMFKRQNGAKVIVATPTLAQGLNLPAHFAILAGDKRADRKGGRESLEAHEILNAAARAGRAGHLANGLVLLIPEPIIYFKKKNELSKRTIEKLRTVLPEDDHCVSITDPLEIVLDRIVAEQTSDPDVIYTINRMAVLGDTDAVNEPDQLFNLRKSLGGFIAQRRSLVEEFEGKIVKLKSAIAAKQSGSIDETTAILASQSGLSAELVLALKERVRTGVGALPTSIEAWLDWTFIWLIEDETARHDLLIDTKSGILTACGRTQNDEIDKDVLVTLLGGLQAWIKGAPLAGIEEILGGEPHSETMTKKVCPRARSLASAVIPRGISFILGIVSHVVKDVDPFEQQEGLNKQLIECLSSAVRRGFDTPEKLFFANDDRAIIGRVQAHILWAAVTF